MLQRRFNIQQTKFRTDDGKRWFEIENGKIKKIDVIYLINFKLSPNLNSIIIYNIIMQVDDKMVK